jgi:hypothetical protein
MDSFPEFVKEKTEERPDGLSSRVNLTGWETVVFQVDDEPESDCSTAAFAP